MLLGHTQITTYAPQRCGARDALSREIFVKLLPVYTDASAYLCNGGMAVTNFPEVLREALMNTHIRTNHFNLREDTLTKVEDRTTHIQAKLARVDYST